ncbi:hypothetical protein M3Y99_01806000 [Aphelenchoides fujianensis]|nr:hypothetical protein M3Y99_01806000 [Aphelenchoides fujianensis]
MISINPQVFLQPARIMKVLSLCFLVLVVVATARNSNDLFCTICTKLVNKIEPLINSTDIIGDAYAICDVITFKEQYLDNLCHNFVDNSLDTIVDDVRAGKNATQICKDLKKC